MLIPQPQLKVLCCPVPPPPPPSPCPGSGWARHASPCVTGAGGLPCGLGSQHTCLPDDWPMERRERVIFLTSLWEPSFGATCSVGPSGKCRGLGSFQALVRMSSDSCHPPDIIDLDLQACDGGHGTAGAKVKIGEPQLGLIHGFSEESGQMDRC